MSRKNVSTSICEGCDFYWGESPLSRVLPPVAWRRHPPSRRGAILMFYGEFRGKADATSAFLPTGHATNKNRTQFVGRICVICSEMASGKIACPFPKRSSATPADLSCAVFPRSCLGLQRFLRKSCASNAAGSRIPQRGRPPLGDAASCRVDERFALARLGPKVSGFVARCPCRS